VRFGKVTDPTSASRQALAFQLAPADPNTNSGHRSEVEVAKNIEYGKVYWAAFRMYVYDWGALASDDDGLFGTQIHSGYLAGGLGPSFCISHPDFDSASGRSDGFRIAVATAPNTNPTTRDEIVTWYPARGAAPFTIPFGQWADFVFKFRHSVDGSQGFVQLWMNGTLILNHRNPLGFNTPGINDYAKFGIYNTSSAMANPSRKILLRHPVLVADPDPAANADQGKYTQGDLRAFINQ
jgi:hypothetical protein